MPVVGTLGYLTLRTVLLINHSGLADFFAKIPASLIGFHHFKVNQVQEGFHPPPHQEIHCDVTSINLRYKFL
jgi:hypothetical protein